MQKYIFYCLGIVLFLCPALYANEEKIDLTGLGLGLSADHHHHYLRQVFKFQAEPAFFATLMIYPDHLWPQNDFSDSLFDIFQTSLDLGAKAHRVDADYVNQLDTFFKKSFPPMTLIASKVELKDLPFSLEGIDAKVESVSRRFKGRSINAGSLIRMIYFCKFAVPFDPFKETKDVSSFVESVEEVFAAGGETNMTVSDDFQTAWFRVSLKENKDSTSKAIVYIRHALVSIEGMGISGKRESCLVPDEQGWTVFDKKGLAIDPRNIAVFDAYLGYPRP